MNSFNQPTKAFRIAALIALLSGISAYMIGLYNATMMLNEKGYYFAVLLFSLFSVVSLQKTIRDKIEEIKTSKAYFYTCWFGTAVSIALMAIGLINADLLLSEKGFFAMAFLLSLFAAITVQKNVRDNQHVDLQAHPENCPTEKEFDHAQEEVA